MKIQLQPILLITIQKCYECLNGCFDECLNKYFDKCFQKCFDGCLNKYFDECFQKCFDGCFNKLHVITARRVSQDHMKKGFFVCFMQVQMAMRADYFLHSL